MSLASKIRINDSHLGFILAFEWHHIWKTGMHKKHVADETDSEKMRIIEKWKQNFDNILWKFKARLSNVLKINIISA